MKSAKPSKDSTNQDGPNQERPNVRFPPPLLVIGFILLGLLIDRIAALPDIPIGRDIQGIGFGMMVAAVALIILSLGLFRASGENPEPWTPSKTIIARGPYRHSRNPMYLGMVIIHLGFALWQASMGTLFFAPIVLVILDRLVIVPEEQYLRQTFGAAYHQYCQRVRRWL